MRTFGIVLSAFAYGRDSISGLREACVGHRRDARSFHELGRFDQTTTAFLDTWSLDDRTNNPCVFELTFDATLQFEDSGIHPP